MQGQERRNEEAHIVCMNPHVLPSPAFAPKREWTPVRTFIHASVSGSIGTIYGGSNFLRGGGDLPSIKAVSFFSR